MTDCDKHCQYITDKIRINNRKSHAVDTDIKSLERIPRNKIDKSNELYQEYMNLLTDRQVCMDDCRRRNHDMNVVLQVGRKIFQLIQHL